MPSRQMRPTVCPTCGKPKNYRSQTCKDCARSRQHFGLGPARGATGRTIDAERVVQSDWRPPHLPPACGRCRGFGYVQTYNPLTHRTDCTRCPACVAHPGSSVSHAAWTATR